MPRKLILVRGGVQGVGYRWFVRETAQQLKLSGWVRNLSNGDVEIEAQGTERDLAGFLGKLETGHPWARIDALTTRDIPEDRALNDFVIRFAP